MRRHLDLIIPGVLLLVIFSLAMLTPLLGKRRVAEAPSVNFVKERAAPPVPLFSARAVFSLYRSPQGHTEVLAAQNGESPLPLASVTKLVTALVAIKNYDQKAEVTVASSSLLGFIDPSVLKAGDKFTIGSLLYPLLVESSNDTAMVLANQIDYADFIKKMNSEAKVIGMKKAHFYNPSGLDPATGPEINVASAHDVARLGNYLLSEAPELLAVTTIQGYDLYTRDGRLHHRLANTDQLLNYQGWPAEVVGGKTGTTNLAKRNLLLILRDKKTDGYLINVVLGADDNFTDMRRLIDWIYSAYQFSPNSN